MERTYNEMIREVTEEYISDINLDSLPSPSTIEYELLQATNRAIHEWNLGPRDESVPDSASMKDKYPDQKPPGERLRKLKVLTNWQIAYLLMHVHNARLICWTSISNPENSDIGIYQDKGNVQGTYLTGANHLERAIRSYNPSAARYDIAEVTSVLKSLCFRVERCSSPDLVAVNNGIYDYRRKCLLPFDPEYVFTSKSPYDFIENAPNPIIPNDEDGTDWDVVSWLDSLSDDPEIVEVLWQILGAVIRPNVRWDKSAWLYSTKGNNGKGTFCALARNLCGEAACESISLKAFGQRFMLEPLTRVSAIITDENDTGTYLDDAAALKSIITGDSVFIDRKFKDGITLKFKGFMVQCVNELPKFRDKTESMYRRLLVIPFDKCFKGRERKCIKSDYLHRREVLEYVLYHVLAETNYYELDEPMACKAMLSEFMEYNDATRQFLADVLPEATWDLLPWQLLHDLYRQWTKRANPSGRAQSKTAFVREVKALMPTIDGWEATVTTARSATKMQGAEPLIVEYGVVEWMDRSYRGPDQGRVATPSDLKERYAGLVRTTPKLPPVGAGPACGDED
ncbi:MAG: phage/plasmid primase, P4 family [Atopobiaceae bacterium]|nr:phage/plasmid primase, P4 family [Atopobiaceae bacterium]